MMFIPSDYLKVAIADGNRVRIHNELCSIIHKDPAFRKKTFWEALDFVEERVPGIIEKHDGDPFEPEVNWNKEYWALVISTLMDNFSRDRIKHAEEVGQKLFGPPIVTTSTASSWGYTNGGSNHSNLNTSKRSVPSKGRLSSDQSRSTTYITGYHISRGNNNLKKWLPIAGITGVVIIGIAAIGIKRATMLAGTVAAIAGTVYLVNKSR